MISLCPKSLRVSKTLRDSYFIKIKTRVVINSHFSDPEMDACNKRVKRYNAEGGNRTHKSVRTREFESRASASSATPA